MYNFVDHKQTYWQLAAIQSVPLGMSAILMGHLLTKQYGSGVAICSIVIANLILWLISIIIISMSYKTRSNAVQNVNNYMGKYGAYFKRFILSTAFLLWFPYQLQSTLPLLEVYFSTKTLPFLGIGLALLTTFLSVGGIRFIKWSCTISFPVVFFYYIYALVNRPDSSPEISSFGISLTAVLTSLGVFLPFAVNSPTFFRHSRSRADSYLSLTLIAIFMSFFQISTIWIKFSYLENYFTLGFIIWVLISTNLFSIYLASASFEGLNQKSWIYFSLGALGSVAYLLLPTSSLFLQNFLNCFIASQGAVLCVAFFIHSLVGYEPHRMAKNINIFCWIMGCIGATIVLIHDQTNVNTSLVAATGTSIASFFCTLFVKENIWAARKLRQKL